MVARMGGGRLAFSMLGGIVACSAMHDSAVVKLQLTTTPFRYSVIVDGQAWFSGAGVTLWRGNSSCSSEDGSFKTAGPPSFAVPGSDGNGEFNLTVVRWTCTSATAAAPTLVETHFIVYAHSVAFDLVFPDGVDSMGRPGDALDTLGSEFPIFSADPKNPTTVPMAGTLGYNLWAGGGVPSTRASDASGMWPPASELALGYSRTALGALAVFNTDGSRTAVLSPAAHFATTVALHTAGGELAFGVHGTVLSVPAGFSSSAVVTVGNGINAAMRDWGEFLLQRSGKPRGRWQSDFSLSHLGYTTDNGAYYYYNTEPGKNYQDTILDLHAYMESMKIPIRWVLYDSWFYLKANKTKSGMMDPTHGVVNWTDADPAIFPSGMRYMYDQTGWPVVAHNRAWSTTNVYSTTNGGSYKFAEGLNPKINENIAIPLEEKFWHDLIGNAKEWGLINYQQDWMYTNQNMEPVMQSATLGRAWQLQMDEALLEFGLNWGYGGTTMANWLQSTEVYSATNGRATNDYHASLGDDWAIGVSSVFTWALDLIPAKDGFWTTPVQPGHPYKDNRTEEHGMLHMTTAVLTRGPVSPADKIGLANRDMIMRSCTANGRLLQPDRPATAIDAQFVKLAFGKGGPMGEVWATESTVGGICYAIILAAQLETPYDAPLSNLGMACASTRTYAAYNNANGTLDVADITIVGPTATLSLPALGHREFVLMQLAPVLPNGYAVLGEVAKVVPMAAARVTGVAAGSDGVSVALRGTADELVTFWFLTPGGTAFSVSCTVQDLGTVTMVVTGSSGACQD